METLKTFNDATNSKVAYALKTYLSAVASVAVGLVDSASPVNCRYKCSL